MDEIPPRPFQLSCVLYPHLISFYCAATDSQARGLTQTFSHVVRLELIIPEGFDEPQISHRVPRNFTLPQVTPRGFPSPLPTGFRPHPFLPHVRLQPIAEQ